MEQCIKNPRPYFYLSISRLIGLCTYGYLHYADSSLSIVSALFLLSYGALTLVQMRDFWDNRFVRTFGFYQICIDVILITILSGEINDINVFAVYLLIIACSSLILNAHATVVVSACAGICFAYTKFFNTDEIVSAYDIILSYFSLVGCALIGVYYAKLLDRLNLSILEKEKTIAQVNQDKQHLIESFSEGIITLDIDSAITGINQAAKTILGLSDSIEENNLDFKSLIDKSTLVNKRELLSLTNGQSTHVHTLKNEKQVKVVCTLQDIRGSLGDSIGSVLFISDNPEENAASNEFFDHDYIVNFVKSIECTMKPAHEKCREIVGESQLLRELLLVVEQAAPSDAPILVLGESGTGKELISRSIHKLSARLDKPFVAINCGAIPDNLLESELFGYKKGSFTGADKDHDGLFVQANNGTLFLDEVAELPLHLQVKLLRVLQEGVLRPIGGSKEVKVNVRIIAATNKNLKDLVKENLFREDLYYRLRVIELMVPPLRSRKTDIPALVYHFLENFGVHLDRTVINSDAWECLLKYDYPGNIRELENIIHRAKVLGSGSINIEHFPEEVRNYRKALNAQSDITGVVSQLPTNLESILENLEVSYLLHALEQSKGVKKDAARLLGLNFRSFRYRLKKYNLSDDEEVDTATFQKLS